MAGELKDRINVSLQAVAQVLLVCGLGIWLAKRHGLNRQAIAAVSGVNWHVLMPALLFSSIVGAVTPSGLVLLWPLLLVSLLHIVIGVIPAWLLGWLARLPRDMLFFTIMAASLPNCGNLPWLFMPAIIRYFTPVDQAAGQIQYMVGLVSVYTIITILVTLTVPFVFQRPPDTLLLPRRRQSLDLDASSREQGDSTAAALARVSASPASVLPAAAAAGGATAAGAKAPLQLEEAVGIHAVEQVPGHDISTISDSGPAPDGQHALGRDLNPFCQAHERSAPHVLVTAGVVVAAAQSTLGDSCASLEVDEEEEEGEGEEEEGPGPQQPPAFFGADHVAQPHLQHRPAVAADSFTSHRDSSQLLQHSKQLLGSFSRSFRHSFSRGMKRSNSLVQLVWSYPHGWHRSKQGHRDAAGVAAAAGGILDAADAGWRCWPSPGPVARCLCGALGLYRVVLAHPAVNLPLGGTIAGIACAAIGPVRSLLVEELAALHWLWLSLVWIGAAAAPLATMQIGAELMQGAPLEQGMHVSRRTQWCSTGIAILVKLILVPLINIACLRSAGLATLVPASDKVYQLLLLVEAAVPAAVTLLVVCGRVYPDIRPLSKILFWQYVASLITLPAFLVWFMYTLDL